MDRTDLASRVVTRVLQVQAAAYAEDADFDQPTCIVEVADVLVDFQRELFKEVRKNADRKRQLDEATVEIEKLKVKLRATPGWDGTFVVHDPKGVL